MGAEQRLVHRSSRRVNDELIRTNRADLYSHLVVDDGLAVFPHLLDIFKLDVDLGDAGAVQRAQQEDLRDRIWHCRDLEVLKQLVAEGDSVVLLLVADVVVDVEPRRLREDSLFDLSNGHLDGLLESRSNELRSLRSVAGILRTPKPPPQAGVFGPSCTVLLVADIPRTLHLLDYVSKESLLGSDGCRVRTAVLTVVIAKLIHLVPGVSVHWFPVVHIVGAIEPRLRKLVDVRNCV